MNTRSGILAGGNWIIDHVKIIDTWPAQDALANILSTTHGTGGSPYNILIDLAKLGAQFPLAAVGLVGQDADGQLILDDCKQYQIDASALQPTDQAPTSFTDVMTVQANGAGPFSTPAGPTRCSTRRTSISAKRARASSISATCCCSTSSTPLTRITARSPRKSFPARRPPAQDEHRPGERRQRPIRPCSEARAETRRSLHYERIRSGARHRPAHPHRQRPRSRTPCARRCGSSLPRECVSM